MRAAAAADGVACLGMMKDFGRGPLGALDGARAAARLLTKAFWRSQPPDLRWEGLWALGPRGAWPMGLNTTGRLVAEVEEAEPFSFRPPSTALVATASSLSKGIAATLGICGLETYSWR